MRTIGSSGAATTRLLAALVVGGLLTSCAAGTMPAVAGKNPSRAGSASASLGTTSQVLTPPGSSDVGAIVTPAAPPAAGGGLVSDSGGSLSGVVRAPAGLVANNGGSLITDNGAGAVSNGVGAYRLASVPERPLAGALVRLLDASGAVIADAAGRPLTATTDAQGRYVFSQALPAQQLLIEVALPEGKGHLKAFAAYASGVKQADLDLISTLTTTYILEKYLRGLPDPIGRLERLSAGMEAETRAKARLAFEDGATAVPEALTAEKLVAAVDQLRSRNEAFDIQLAEVKKVLVVAGQSDLGSGKLGTQVDIRNVQNLIPGPGGALYINARFDRRVWRLRADGVIETAIGKGGTVPSPVVEGLAGPDAALGQIEQAALDGQGRLLVVDSAFTPERGNVFRLGADGILETLWKGPNKALCVFPVGDDVLVMTTFEDEDEDEAAELWRLTPGQAPRLVKRYGADEPAVGYLLSGEDFGVDADGVPWFTSAYWRGSTDLLFRSRLDPATGVFTMVDQRPESGFCLALDGLGRAFEQGQDRGTLKVFSPDGTTKTLALPAEGRLFLEAAALGPDGALYLAGSGKVARVGADGLAKRLVGTDGGAGGMSADAAAVTAGGLAVDAQGALFVSELGTKRVVRIQDGQATPLYVPPVGTSPRTLRFDGEGRLHVVLGSGASPITLARLDAAGQATTIYTWPASKDVHREVEDVAIAPSGAVYAVHYEGDAYEVKRLPLNGFTALRVATMPDLANPRLAIGPDGALYIADEYHYSDDDDPALRLRRWTEAGLTVLVEHKAGDEAPSVAGLACDARGRLYVTEDANNRVLRYEAASKTFTTIAGEGGEHFSGSGVDDSLEDPWEAVFDGRGDLYISDSGHKQIKRIPADQL